MSMKKLWQNAKVRVAIGITLFGGLISAGVYYVKNAGGKGTAGVVVNGDTIAKTDTTKADTAKLN